jgi:lipoyl(octanoyl) transferase
VTRDWKNLVTAGEASRSEGLPLTSHPSLAHRHSGTCLTVDLGLIPYADAHALQKRLVAARKANAIADVLLLCEHPHVITLGRNGKRENLLASDQVLKQKGVDFCATDRGGDITYHGPGQIVGYPILNLAAVRRDVVWYVRMLEEAMIRTTAEFKIEAVREAGKTGIWVQTASPAAEKLGAIGVHLSRWVTSHGFAYNVFTDLRYFDLIVPCGIAERKATSLEKLLARRVDSSEVAPNLVHYFGEVFGRKMEVATPQDLVRSLQNFEDAFGDLGVVRK